MAELVAPQTIEDIRELRDRKVRPVLNPFRPVWLVEERLIPEEDSVLFNVVFEDPQYGWLNRRYRYDAFDDVLYHMGERRVSEAEVLSIQRNEPYLNGNLA
ncbi:MAG: hypothetical protein M5R40_01310 [Anaerolineae bacterium]|nr:hypothetical protein [Anaerolineae bacterium]